MDSATWLQGCRLVCQGSLQAMRLALLETPYDGRHCTLRHTLILAGRASFYAAVTDLCRYGSDTHFRRSPGSLRVSALPLRHGDMLALRTLRTLFIYADFLQSHRSSHPEHSSKRLKPIRSAGHVRLLRVDSCRSMQHFASLGFRFLPVYTRAENLIEGSRATRSAWVSDICIAVGQH
jgi:hypothetical protein